METRQRLEAWPIIDAEFEPAAHKSAARTQQSHEPIPVTVKRRVTFHTGGPVRG